jgi:hypothetical protein
MIVPTWGPTGTTWNAAPPEEDTKKEIGLPLLLVTVNNWLGFSYESDVMVTLVGDTTS